MTTLFSRFKRYTQLGLRLASTMWFHYKKSRSKFQPSASYSIENYTPSLVQKAISLNFFLFLFTEGIEHFQGRSALQYIKANPHSTSQNGTVLVPGEQIKQSGVVGPEKLKILHVLPGAPRVLVERGQYTGECPARYTHNQQRFC